MTLVPERPTLADEENPELLDFQSRFTWTLPLTASVTTLSMGGDRIAGIPPTQLNMIELLLTLPIVLWAGKPFFERAVPSLVHCSPNMLTLVGLGTAAAFS